MNSSQSAPGAGVVLRSAQRGRLEVTDRVIQRIASQVASEVTEVAANSTGLNRLARRDRGKPQVQVRLTAEYCDLDLSVAVRYPTSIAEAAAQIRRQVTSEVERLTGVPVRRVDIQIDRLVYLGRPTPVAAPAPRSAGPAQLEPQP